jgi:hypothetical protein
VKSERQLIEEILEKQVGGHKLTEREARMLAYSPYGTVARSSFAPVERRSTTERKE